MAKRKGVGSAWDSVMGVVKAAAPVVASALGSPLAGIAVKGVIDALGVDSEEQAIQALSTDPNAVLKLKTAQLELQKFMRDADIREDELEVRDRGDARAMMVALGKIWPQFSIVLALTLMISGVIFALFTVEPAEANQNILYMVLGQLLTAWIASIHFFVGTTKSSGDKTSAHLDQLRGL